MIRALLRFISDVRIARVVQKRYAIADPRFRPMPLLTLIYITWKYQKKRPPV
jgi:hypothetical protein